MDALKAKVAAALDGHTEYSRDCHLSGEYLAGLVWPIIGDEIERIRSAVMTAVAQETNACQQRVYHALDGQQGETHGK